MMTLEKVRKLCDEWGNVPMSHVHMPSEYLSRMRDAIDAHLAREVNTRPNGGEAVAVDALMNLAASELPDGYNIEIGIERDAGWVDLVDPEGYRIASPSLDNGMTHAIKQAIDAAMAEAAEGGV